jgi:hypothetical protein
MAQSFIEKLGNTAGMSSKAYFLVRMKFHSDIMSWQLVRVNNSLKIFSETIGR